MILALDPGLAACGWAIVTPSSGAVKGLGCLVTEIDRGLRRSTDRARRAGELCRALGALISTWGVSSLALESPLLHGNPNAAAAQVLIWGAAVTLAVERRLPLVEVVAKGWQRAILPGKGKVPYEQVKARLASYVPAELLGNVPAGVQTHALDAVGVGVYAALRPTIGVLEATA